MNERQQFIVYCFSLILSDCPAMTARRIADTVCFLKRREQFGVANHSHMTEI